MAASVQAATRFRFQDLAAPIVADEDGRIMIEHVEGCKRDDRCNCQMHAYFPDIANCECKKCKAAWRRQQAADRRRS